jgi:hypothetical protein
MRALLEKFDHTRAAWWAGILGVSLISMGSLISALAYRGRLGEPYSPLNHFVSELGEVRVAPLALGFNTGVFAGGLFLVVFLLGLGRRIGGWLGVLFGLAGVACGISGAMVGVYPMDNLQPHITWAMRFFYLGLLMSAVFSLLALLRRGGLSRWLALPGLFSALAFASFLYLPTPEPGIGSQPGRDPLAAMTNALGQPRAAVWGLAVLEWLAVLSVLGWALWVAIVLLREQRRLLSSPLDLAAGTPPTTPMEIR